MLVGSPNSIGTAFADQTGSSCSITTMHIGEGLNLSSGSSYSGSGSGTCGPVGSTAPASASLSLTGQYSSAGCQAISYLTFTGTLTAPSVGYSVGATLTVPGPNLGVQTTAATLALDTGQKQVLTVSFSPADGSAAPISGYFDRCGGAHYDLDISGVASTPAPPTAPDAGPIDGFDFTAPLQSEPLSQTYSYPDANATPVFDKNFGTGGQYVAVGAGKVYVLKDGNGYIYDSANGLAQVGTFGFARCPGGLAYYRGELFVGDACPYPTESVINVYDASTGAQKRTLHGDGDLRPAGLDVAWGQLWVKSHGITLPPPADVNANHQLDNIDTLKALDIQTGVIQNIVPLGIHTPLTKPPDGQDVSVSPDSNAVITGNYVVPRSDVAIGGVEDSLIPKLAGAQNYGLGDWYQCTNVNQQPDPSLDHVNLGSTSVWGMNYLMRIASCPNTLPLIEEWQLSKDGTGQPQVNCHAALCGLNNLWAPQDQTYAPHDIGYQPHPPKIVWLSGNLPDPVDWMAGTQCVRYIITDGDYYIVGPSGEHWFHPASGFQPPVQLLLDGQPVTLTSGDPTQVTSTLCFDTAHAYGPSGPPDASGVHNLTMTAVVYAQQISQTNGSLHLDHDGPTGLLDPPKPYARATVAVTGTMADPQAGPRDWQLQLSPHGQNSWSNAPGCGSVAAPDPNTGKYTCQWDTTRVGDGTYDARIQMRDLVDPAFAGPNVSYTPLATTVVDNTPPSLAEPAPAVGSVYSDTIQRPVEEVLFQQDDNLSGIDHTDLSYNTATDGSANGSWTPTGAAPATETGEAGTNWDTTNVSDGLHRVRAVTYDRAGNSRSTEWQVAVDARRRCPANGTVRRCYAGERIGAFAGAGRAPNADGVRARQRTPNGVPSFFSVNHESIRGSADRSLETGLAAHDCPGRASNDGWYSYSAAIQTNRTVTIQCYGRTGAGANRIYEVFIQRGGHRWGHVRIEAPAGVLRDRIIVDHQRKFYLGPRGKSEEAAGETQRYGTNIEGYFTSVAYLPFSGPWQPQSYFDPIRIGPGYDLNNTPGAGATSFCVHGPNNSCTAP